jgi:hypothetical protein
MDLKTLKKLESMETQVLIGLIGLIILLVVDWMVSESAVDLIQWFTFLLLWYVFDVLVIIAKNTTKE